MTTWRDLDMSTCTAMCMWYTMEVARPASANPWKFSLFFLELHLDGQLVGDPRHARTHARHARTGRQRRGTCTWAPTGIELEPDEYEMSARGQNAACRQVLRVRAGDVFETERVI